MPASGEEQELAVAVHANRGSDVLFWIGLGCGFATIALFMSVLFSLS